MLVFRVTSEWKKSKGLCYTHHPFPFFSYDYFFKFVIIISPLYMSQVEK